MGVKERREREKSETRDKILDAARELFVTEGYEGVSMRKVAEKHFPHHYLFMFMTPHPPHELDEEDREIVGNPEMDAYALLKLAVQGAIDAGCFREEVQDAELVSQTLWAGVHGVISLNIAKCKDPWVEWRPLQDRAEMMLDVALRGLTRSPLLPADKSLSFDKLRTDLIAKDARNGPPDAALLPDLPTEEK
jgi:hypothetical protein